MDHTRAVLAVMNTILQGAGLEAIELPTRWEDLDRVLDRLRAVPETACPRAGGGAIGADTWRLVRHHLDAATEAAEMAGPRPALLQHLLERAVDDALRALAPAVPWDVLDDLEAQIQTRAVA